MARVRFRIFSLSMFAVGILVIAANAQTNAVLRGSVFDPSGEAVIPGFTVVIRGNGISQEVETNSDGEFIFRLPEGAYEITTKNPHYFPLKRSPVVMSASEPTILNLYPSLKVLSVALTLTKKGAVDEYSYAQKPQYTNLSLPKLGDGKIALVEFKKKVVRKRSTTYQVVTITSGVLTISASELIVTPTRIDARGNVLVDENGKKTRFPSYVLN